MFTAEPRGYEADIASILSEIPALLESVISKKSLSFHYFLA